MWRPTMLAAAVTMLAPGAGGAPPAPDLRVLFIGNSLTYTNDLPRMVERLADGRISSEAVAYPDFSLGDHWQQGGARKAIRRGGWTHVVLQQGPSSLPESRRLLVRDAKRFAPEVERAGARLVLYGVWPGRDREAFFEAVTASYAAAAAETGGSLVPVGDGWRAAWAQDASLPLYGADGFHPSRMGSYLAALMLARHVTGAEVRARPLPGVGAGARQLAILDAAATASLAASRR